ncbi:MAG: DUF1292 domain-containing protein [Solirubrobacterales bacterium]
MHKPEQFLRDEKEKYGKLYVNLSFAADNIAPFVGEIKLSRRQYYSKFQYLKRYLELIDSAELEIKNSSFLEKFGENKYVDLLKDYKNKNIKYFNQLEKCSKCSCLNCAAECSFGSCLSCRENSNIVSCDHEKINVTKHDSFILNLKNDKTGEEDRYIVLATMEDPQKSIKYIAIENISTDEKFILHYIPGISEDTYGEITDPEEFDYIVSVLQSTN